MHAVLKQIEEIGLVPVIKIDREEEAPSLARALMDGGLPCAEITFRTEAAEGAIRRIRAEVPEMLIGAGTVLNVEQVDKAVAAGASFIVSPGLNPRVVSYCLQNRIPVVPGVSTPSDIEAAIELGLDTVKFFPAEANGGIKAIKAMAAPYTTMRFMPTGGINASNIRDYMSFDRILACGGSWMVPEKALKSGDYAAITSLTREAVHAMLGFTLSLTDADTVTVRTTSLVRAVRYLRGEGLAVSTVSDETVLTGNLSGRRIVLAKA